MMADRLRNVTRLFLDSAPVVYYVEEDTRYLARVDPVFDAIDAGTLIAVTSPVTLAECLVLPYRDARSELLRGFTELLLSGPNVVFASIDNRAADKAASLRARYNLALTDAFQLAIAIETGCDALLTNDHNFKRVNEIDVIVVADVTDT